MFIDEVRILVKAGDGGNGCLAFRREKFVPRGGPSGGDGGRGGDVIMVCSEHANTLLQFRFNPEHKAERGRHGEGSQRTGAEGESIEVKVPVGHRGLRRSYRRKALRFHCPGESSASPRVAKAAAATSISPLPHTRLPPSTNQVSQVKKSAYGWN